jgi:putative redox protein
MSLATKMTWKGGIKFEGTGVCGRTLLADDGSGGFTPPELLLWGIAGCTGIDIVRILEKQRQELTALDIEILGEQRDTYPKPFHTITVKYIATGRNLDRAKVARAIDLSERKFCVVGQTVQRETTVTSSFEIREG